MIHHRRGFTLIEMLIVVVLGAILTQMAIRGVGLVSSHISAREARNVFQGMVARTRAQAIESGLPTVLIADAVGDSVMVLAGGRIVENVHFGQEMGIDIQTEAARTQLCMTPRGFANTTCNSFSSPLRMTFVRGSESETILILPLGQLRWE